MVTVVVPTRNEQTTLAGILNECKPYADELLVVDGHSTDDTRKIAAKISDAGADFVDCPVGGTVAPALRGQLLGMAGGTDADGEPDFVNAVEFAQDADDADFADLLAQ